MELTKYEEFAKKIVKFAAEEGMTVFEFYNAIEIAKEISKKTVVDAEIADKFDFLSQRCCCSTKLFDTTEF